MSMSTAVEIHFHGLDRSEALEDRVRAKVAKLARHCERMTRCRVVLGAAQRTAQRPKIYQIKIEMSIARRSPVIVVHEREGSHAGEELLLAVREAFEIARRKADGLSTRIGARGRLERGRRRPSAPSAEA